MKKKQPILASVLSAFVFPGIGQIYNKQYKKGLSILVASAVALFFTLKPLVLSYVKLINEYAEAETIDISQIKMQIAFQPDTLLVILLTIVWLFSVVDAYICAKKQNNISESIN